MIVVTVEIWPGGNAARRKTLGTMNITNVSDLAEISDYSVAAYDANESTSTVATVYDHHRDTGFWQLVKKAIEALC